MIIIVSCREHGYPWHSLATSPYRSSPPAGLQGYIAYPHIAAECTFELVVLLLPDHMRGFIGVRHLWDRPCFSSRKVFKHKISRLFLRMPLKFEMICDLQSVSEKLISFWNQVDLFYFKRSHILTAFVRWFGLVCWVSWHINLCR